VALTCSSLVLVASAARAQPHAHAHAPDARATAELDHAGAGSPRVLGLPMTREGSGTAWLPDASPMRALHVIAGGWELMFHGNLFVGYDYQATDAGDEELVSQNYAMVMARRALGTGSLGLRVMLSLEPLTVGKSGYPLLLQTGESVEGEPLVDRQHPHDLFMELASTYEHALTEDVGLQIYGALAGEPALGPVAFPHRPSSFPDPLAPLSHHWQDSTHILFGVVTAGLFTRSAKLEASWFNGREPDEERYDLDLRGFDSVSTRLTVNPSPAWSLQGSYGYLASPEVLEPDVSVHRVTASALHARRLGDRRSWTSSLAWGRNVPSHGPATDALLGETALDLGGLGVTFARAEYVVKSGHDFDFPEEMDELELPIANFSLGHSHPVASVAGLETSLGIRGSIGYVDEALEARYGTRTPYGVMAFVQVQPEVMMHGRARSTIDDSRNGP
jgi:hypothetical protein